MMGSNSTGSNIVIYWDKNNNNKWQVGSGQNMGSIGGSREGGGGHSYERK